MKKIKSYHFYCKKIYFQRTIILCMGYNKKRKKKLDRDPFHEGLNSDCFTFLIYNDIVLTGEQIKAHHNFIIRRYNIDADPVI